MSLDDRVARLEAQLRATRRLLAVILVAAPMAIAFASCKSAPPATKLEFVSGDKLVRLDVDGLTMSSGVGEHKHSLELREGGVHASDEVVVASMYTKTAVTLHPDKLALEAPQIHANSDGLSGPLVKGPWVALEVAGREASLRLGSLETTAAIFADSGDARVMLRGTNNAGLVARSGDAHTYANAGCVIVDKAGSAAPEHAALCATKQAIADLEKFYNP